MYPSQFVLEPNVQRKVSYIKFGTDKLVLHIKSMFISIPFYRNTVKQNLFAISKNIEWCGMPMLWVGCQSFRHHTSLAYVRRSDSGPHLLRKWAHVKKT